MSRFEFASFISCVRVSILVGACANVKQCVCVYA